MRITFKRVKCVRIAIHPPQGEVRVSAPYWMSRAQVELMLAEKQAWIQAQQEKILKRHQAMEAQVPPELRHLSPAERLRHQKRTWQTELRNAVPELLYPWMQRLNIEQVSWSLRYMRTRWGTCNPRRKKITLSLTLGQFGRECLEYVLVHELVHLRIHNHGPEFKAEMDRHIPNWRAIQRTLNPKS